MLSALILVPKDTMSNSTKQWQVSRDSNMYFIIEVFQQDAFKTENGKYTPK